MDGFNVNIKEYGLFTSPVWEVKNELNDIQINELVSFAYDCVRKFPLDKPVSKRNGFNSIPLNIANATLVELLNNSLAAVKSVYEPNVPLVLEKYWININPPGSYNIRHTHPRAVLACTLYIQTPKNSGDIVLYNMNAAQVNADYSSKRAQHNFTEYRIRPTPGTFVAFPGWLDHSVDINESDTDRISISMNILKG